jgi:hypothetical protein
MVDTLLLSVSSALWQKGQSPSLPLMGSPLTTRVIGTFAAMITAERGVTRVRRLVSTDERKPRASAEPFEEQIMAADWV